MCTLIQSIKTIKLLLIFLPTWITLFGQNKPVLLTNPSFEDIPQHSQPPSGWYFCGPIGESPPDVHPNGYFKVEHEAHHGDTYVGMVTRDNGTWEAIGQRLEIPLEVGQCYQFSIFLAQSATYQSASRSTGDFALFTTPVKLRIWGSTQNCKRTELLAVSKAIEQETWTRYTFLFQPQQSLTHLLLEVYYQDQQDEPYNGNLLMDFAGPIIPLDCTSQKPIVDIVQIQVSQLNTADQLIQTIIAHGPEIRFTQTGLQLEQHLFKDQNGDLHQGNQHLWIIAQAMRQFPKQKLTIAVSGSGEFELLERKFYLDYALREAGLSHSQFRLKTWRRTSSKKRWLWGEGEILMGVE